MQKCEWIVDVPEGNNVELSFKAFRLESGIRDWVQIHDGGGSSSPKLTPQLGGTRIPGNVISTGNKIFVHWETANARRRRDTINADSNEYKGFKILVKSKGTYNQCHLE